MRKKLFLLITVICILFTTVISCKKSNEDFVYKTIFKSEHAGTYNIPKQQMVITSANEWKPLIAKLSTSEFSEIDIDFAKYTVIAVFDEVKTNGGYAVEINSVVVGVEAIFISIEYKNNVLGGAAAPAVITQPCHIIKIKKTNKPIIFK